MIKRLCYTFSFFIVLLFLPLTVFGHSTVTSIEPTPNSKLESAPEEVIITFNSEIDDKNYSLKIVNHEQQEIETPKAVISPNNKTIKLELPLLTEGSYTVTYNIISAKDGHHLQDSFTFIVGNHTTDIGNEEKESKLQINDMLIYLFRSIYYFGLLMLIGWIFWHQILPRPKLPEQFPIWGTIAQMIHLLGFICYILTQMVEITDSGLVFQLNFSNSVFSISVVGTLLLSLIGFFLLFKTKWFDLIWGLSIVLLKGINGHTFEFNPSILFVTANIFHIITAAVWVSGLIYMSVFWKKQKWYVDEFLPYFKKFAITSILLLIVTGTALSFGILPNLDTLFQFDWGKALLVKVFLVILVIFTGGLIQRKMRREEERLLIRKWIIVDEIMMGIIILLVAILTYLSPLG